MSRYSCRTWDSTHTAFGQFECQRRFPLTLRFLMSTLIPCVSRASHHGADQAGSFGLKRRRIRLFGTSSDIGLLGLSARLDTASRHLLDSRCVDAVVMQADMHIVQDVQTMIDMV